MVCAGARLAEPALSLSRGSPRLALPGTRFPRPMDQPLRLVRFSSVPPANGSGERQAPSLCRTTRSGAAPTERRPPASIAYRSNSDRQPVRRAEREADDVAGLGRIEAQVGQAVEQRVQRRAGLEQRQVRAGAEVRAEAEGEMIVVLAVQVEAIGVVVVALVAVGRADDHRQHAAGRHRRGRRTRRPRSARARRTAPATPSAASPG